MKARNERDISVLVSEKWYMGLSLKNPFHSFLFQPKTEQPALKDPIFRKDDIKFGTVPDRPRLDDTYLLYGDIMPDTPTNDVDLEDVLAVKPSKIIPGVTWEGDKTGPGVDYVVIIEVQYHIDEDSLKEKFDGAYIQSCIDEAVKNDDDSYFRNLYKEFPLAMTSGSVDN